jgi:hypothetical protein
MHLLLVPLQVSFLRKDSFTFRGVARVPDALVHRLFVLAQILRSGKIG